MPQVTITFAEDGQDPAAFVLPDWVVAALQQYVDENPTQYTGKADLFKQWALRDLVTPLCTRYASFPVEVLTLLAQRADIETQLATAKASAIAGAIAPPE